MRHRRMIHEDVSQGTPRSKWAVITVVVFATHALIASITVVVLALIHLHNVDSAELVGERSWLERGGWVRGC